MRRSARALPEWAVPANNPFLVRAIRIDCRRQMLVTALATIALACILTVAVLLYYEQELLDDGSQISSYSLRHLPAWAGGNAVGLLALLVAGISGYLIRLICNARVAQLLQREEMNATLVALQTLPLREEFWLWQISALPVAMGLVLGLAGLPVYFLAWFCGLWTLGDIASLMLVFAVLGYAMPVWKPRLWHFGKRGARASSRQTRRVLRAQSQGVAVWSMSSVQRLELNRRVQRALAEDGTATPAGISATEAKGRVEKPLLGAAGRELRPALGLAALTSEGAEALSLLKWYLILRLLSEGFAGLGPVGRIVDTMRADLPRSVNGLLPSLLLSWPLVAARLLWAPLPFLAFQLPPVVLAAPFFIVLKLQRNLTLASQVSTADSFWTLRRVRARRSYAIRLWALGVLALLGYCWKAAITTGFLSELLPGAPPTAGAALAALWTVFIAAGALAGAVALGTPFVAVMRGESTLKQSWHQALTAAACTTTITIGGYFALCWAGGFSGGSALWLLRLVPTLCSFAAFCLAALGCWALGAWLQPKARKLWMWTLICWISYGPLLVLGQLMYSENWPLKVGNAVVFASPLVSLFSIFALGLDSTGQVPWWFGSLLQAGLGTLCLFLIAPALMPTEIGVAATWRPLLAVWLVLRPPLRLFYRVVEAVCWPMMALLRLLYSAFTCVLNGLIGFFANLDATIARRGIACDNAVFTAELRTRLRHSSWSRQWLRMQLIAIVTWLVCAHPWDIGSGLGYHRYWAETTALCTAFVGWMVAIFSTTEVARAFLRDRANGALVFTLLSPISDEAILAGKVGPHLILGIGKLFAMAVPLLSAVVVGLGTADPMPIWLSLTGTLLAFSTLLCQGTLQLTPALLTSNAAVARGSMLGLLLEAGILTVFVQRASASEFDFGIVCILFSFFAVVHLALALVFWRLARLALRRRRYGDVEAAGSRVG